MVIWEGQRCPVARIVARWRTPMGPGFRIETEGGRIFDLQYRDDQDGWEVSLLTHGGCSGPTNLEEGGFSDDPGHGL